MLRTTIVFVEILCALVDGDLFWPEWILEVILPNNLCYFTPLTGDACFLGIDISPVFISLLIHLKEESLLQSIAKCTCGGSKISSKISTAENV